MYESSFSPTLSHIVAWVQMLWLVEIRFSAALGLHTEEAVTCRSPATRRDEQQRAKGGSAPSLSCGAAAGLAAEALTKRVDRRLVFCCDLNTLY